MYKKLITFIFLFTLISYPQNAFALILKSDIGINHAENSFKEAADLGVGIQRLNVIWKNLQKEPLDNFDIYTELFLHKQINEAKQNGVKTILLIESPPESVCGNECPAIYNMDYYENFLDKLLKEFGNDVIGIEIYNEPDREVFWPPKPNPENYVEILKKTKEIRDRISPALKIILGGNSGPPNPDKEYTFLYDIYEYGAKGLFDIFNYHHYTQNEAPDEGWSNPDYWYSIFDKFFSEYDPKMKIWVTEVGYNTDKNLQIASEKLQATNLIKIYSMLFSYPRIEKVFLYELKDSVSNSLKYGLLDQHLSPKESFDGVKKFFSLIKNKTPEYKLQNDNNLAHYTFYNDSEKLHVLWLRKTYKYPKPGNAVYYSNKNIVLSPQYPEIHFFDAEGNEKYIEIIGDEFTVNVGSEPVIIIEKLNSENEEQVSFLKENNIASGFSDGLFHPERYITRSELLKMTFNALNITTENIDDDIPFPDIDPDSWAYKYAVKAKNLGIVKGDNDGLFYPDRKVTKYEAIKILTAAKGITENELNINIKDIPNDSPFIPYIKEALSLEIIPNESYLNGNRYLYRGEMADMIYKLLNNEKNTDLSD